MLPRLAASSFSGLTLSLATLSCLTASPTALAMDLNLDHEFYFVASMGRSDIDESAAYAANERLIQTHLNATDKRSSQTTKDGAYKLVMGFEFKPSFALEVAYVDLGTNNYAADYTANAGGPVSQPITNNTIVDVTANMWAYASSRREVKYSGFAVNAVAKKQLKDKLTVFGKLGLFLAEARTTDITLLEGFNYGGLGFGRSANTTKRSVRPTFGLGADYMFKPNLGLRLEAERYSKLGDEDMGRTDVDLMSLGLIGRF